MGKASTLGAWSYEDQPMFLSKEPDFTALKILISKNNKFYVLI